MSEWIWCVSVFVCVLGASFTVPCQTNVQWLVSRCSSPWMCFVGVVNVFRFAVFCAGDICVDDDDDDDDDDARCVLLCLPVSCRLIRCRQLSRCGHGERCCLRWCLVFPVFFVFFFLFVFVFFFFLTFSVFFFIVFSLRLRFPIDGDENPEGVRSRATTETWQNFRNGQRGRE